MINTSLLLQAAGKVTLVSVSVALETIEMLIATLKALQSTLFNSGLLNVFFL
jgi:hypothetical protein